MQQDSSVNPNFQFTAKLFQGFTHIPRGAKSPSPFQLTISPKDEGLVREGLDSLANEGRLGAVLVQFPVSFKNADDTRDYLFSLVRASEETVPMLREFTNRFLEYARLHVKRAASSSILELLHAFWRSLNWRTH